MTVIPLALHILGAVVWVGGMFLLYMCIRPALPLLDPPQRLRLQRASLGRFFIWVWIAIGCLLVGGYWMISTTLGGFARLPAYVNAMQAIGWIMIVLFLYLFHGPWLKFKRAVDAGDFPTAAGHHDRIRQIVAINLPLGLIVVIIGATGRYW